MSADCVCDDVYPSVFAGEDATFEDASVDGPTASVGWEILGDGAHTSQSYPGSKANLSASAFSSDVGLQLAKQQAWEVFGGHAPGKQGRGGVVDMARFVSPLQPDCSRFFAYLSTGHVEPSLQLVGSFDWDRADYTIKLLNLNSPLLVGLRKDWWDELTLCFEQHLLSEWSLEHLAHVDLVPSGHRLSRFFSLTRSFYGFVAESVLSTHAPDLV